ncbi:hypothetical protein CRV15_00405 [Streptomyces clavuligerus]|uniref:Uncharacterized protein n=1 Tax=Streptomyces clavuligerus TaxID=1901 RepID=B5GZF1_STRCL|nr:hypothetical protein D1794_00405 [Streptomyces clavuligerus]EDY51697.1 hypothetical protein SSCG_04725 [Streptomyces clavuligerus]EFG10709.1 Hypothetical protein SCLAV_5642 [Streptomyces clavuligerus]QCS04181.1 hypothetical protein CRV15_00405 [Streptomyces clavuligerus]QPJ96431.1 hypothetical protein GE265_27465 [Streptomyces clavuligerus]
MTGAKRESAAELITELITRLLTELITELSTEPIRELRTELLRGHRPGPTVLPDRSGPAPARGVRQSAGGSGTRRGTGGPVAPTVPRAVAVNHPEDHGRAVR